jgi:hypothetical protein
VLRVIQQQQVAAAVVVAVRGSMNVVDLVIGTIVAMLQCCVAPGLLWLLWFPGVGQLVGALSARAPSKMV